MKSLALLLIAACMLGLPSCSTAPRQPDPFDVALSAAMLQMLTAPAPAAQQGGGQ